MNVCFVLPQGRVSGAERVLLELVQARPAAHLSALCPEGSDLSALLAAEGVSVRHLLVPKRAESKSAVEYAAQIGRAMRDIRRSTRDLKPDVLHVFLPLALKAALPTILTTRIPAVLSVHDVLTPESIGGTKSALNRLASLPVASIVAVSEYVKGTLAQSGYDPRKLTTVHNGVDVDRFTVTTQKRNEVRQSLGLKDHDFTFGVLGRLTPWKGQTVALEALAELRRKGYEAKLLIVGSPFYPSDESYAAALPTMAADLGIAEYVRFVPTQRNVASFYAASDAILVPSTRPDPFPTVVLEAGAAGRPVIATSLGGASEAIIAGATGLVAAPGKRSFADAMAQLVSSGEHQLMGKTAHHHIASQFSSRSYVSKIVDVWARATRKA